MTNNTKINQQSSWLVRQGIPFLLLLAVLLVLPLFYPDDFALNRIARYLVLAILALSLSLSWGQGGILNLGQALSFGIGSYCLAMGLKLRDVAQYGLDGDLPDFMVWNNVETLPWVWNLFNSMSFTLFAGIAVPMLISALLGWFMFRGRVTGVFVAVMTLAAMVVANLLIVDQQKYTGGLNGITNLAQLELFGITFDAYSSSTYYLVLICLMSCLFLGLVFTNSRAGLITQAIRDQEDRVRFFGYDVGLYKTVILALSGAVAGLAGMLYTVVMEFASPTFLDVKLSLTVVIWVAVGGRNSLFGAIIGTLAVAGTQGALSETALFLNTWTLIMGAFFVFVVLFLPNGLVGLIESSKKFFVKKQVEIANPKGEQP